MGRPAPLPALAASRERPRRALPARLRAHRASGRGSGRWPSPTAASGTARTASTAGSASRAARSTPRRRRSSPTSPTRSPTAPRSAPTPWCSRSRSAPTVGPTGVVYWRDGVERRQRARVVAVAGYAIETPRLLLNSTSSRFPDGLCNDHDLVGRYVMVQGAAQTAGRFDEEVRMYKAPPPEVSTEAFYETDPPSRSQARLLHPVRRAAARSRGRSTSWPKATGARCCGSTCATTCTGRRSVCCVSSCRWPTTGSPSPTRPTATASESPGSATPSATTTRLFCGRAPTRWREILDAAGAEDTVTIERYAHLVGGCRMGATRADGVVDADLAVVRRPEPLRHRRQRAADPGQRQPRAHDHGAGRPLRRPAHVGQPRVSAVHDAIACTVMHVDARRQRLHGAARGAGVGRHLHLDGHDGGRRRTVRRRPARPRVHLRHRRVRTVIVTCSHRRWSAPTRSTRLGPGRRWSRAIRNVGRPGVARWPSPPSTSPCGI